MDIKVTDVKVYIINKSKKLKGIASIIINDSIFIHNISIIANKDKLYCSMPSKQNRERNI